MPSLQLYRRRIKSINSTRQITKAMELVAASKMRKAQDQTLRLREYASITSEFVKLLSSVVDPKTHPLLASHETKHGLAKKLIIVITSDRGLAGAYNSGLLRKLLEKQDGTIEYVTIGKKGQDFLTRLGKPIIATFTKFAPHPSIQDITPIVKLASDGFLNKEYQSIHIAYTEFVSTIKQVPQVIQLLPLTAEEVQPRGLPTYGVGYKFEPNRDDVLEFILPRALEIIIYRAILESIAAEHSSRMIAMKSASDNAKDLVDDLALSYNSVRQAKITQELAEIAIGAEAIS